MPVNSATILIVGEGISPQVRARHLRDAGYRVIEVSRGDALMTLAAQPDVTLVLFEGNLPVMSPDLARSMLSQGRRSPTDLVHGHGSAADPERSAVAPTDIDSTSLLQQIDAALK